VTAGRERRSCGGRRHHAPPRNRELRSLLRQKTDATVGATAGRDRRTRPAGVQTAILQAPETTNGPEGPFA
jgi:hypothetical protein